MVPHAVRHYSAGVAARTIRPARPEDVPQILAMIRELAVYEREPDAVKTTAADLSRVLFEGSATPHGAPAAYCEVVADQDPASGSDGLVAMALWFLNFSTWEGSHGIYLEDLYVRPHARGHGHGRALLEHLARICVDKGYARLEWWVLDWNTPAIGFYRSLGAVAMDEWTVNRVSGATLRQLAGAPARGTG